MISVIVPYRDAAEWIGRCAESLRVQKGDARFILVNDNSKDGGDEIAWRHAREDARFVLLENSRSPGVSGARNTGLDAAAGEWITFLDADDEMLPDAIDIMERTVHRYDAQIYQFNHLRYYTKINKEALKYANASGFYTIENPPKMWFGVWNKIYKAELVQDVRFDERIQYGEDGLFNLACLAKAKRIRHMSRETVTVRHRFDNPESLSRKKAAADLIKQARAYESFLLRQTDPAVRRFVCEELSRLWGGATFRRTFGEEYESRGKSAGPDLAV